MRWEQCRESELMSSSKGVDISKGLCPMTLRSVPMACHEWSKFSIFFIVRQHSSAVAYGLRTLQVAFRTKVVVPPKMKALFLPALTVERSARNALGSEHVETLVSNPLISVTVIQLHACSPPIVQRGEPDSEPSQRITETYIRAASCIVAGSNSMG